MKGARKITLTKKQLDKLSELGDGSIGRGLVKLVEIGPIDTGLTDEGRNSPTTVWVDRGIAASVTVIGEGSLSVGIKKLLGVIGIVNNKRLGVKKRRMKTPEWPEKLPELLVALKEFGDGDINRGINTALVLITGEAQ